MSTTRQDVANWALRRNGDLNGVGYPGPHNPFSEDLGHPNEFWCGDFVTDAFDATGIPLPSMQVGCKTGYAYCPSGLNFARAHNAVIPSWRARPADIILINTGNGDSAGHTELVTALDGDWLYTIGGDSGPSNIDGYTGQGGVHRHKWYCPPGVGNSAIVAVVDTSKLVHFGAPGTVHQPPQKHKGPRFLMLKSPGGSHGHRYMHGRDVKWVQKRLNAYGNHITVDSEYGPVTAQHIGHFQRVHGLHEDQVVGPKTHAALKRKPGGKHSKKTVLETAVSVPSSVKSFGAKVLAKALYILKHEPVAVWGVVAAAALGVLASLGVTSGVTSVIAGALSLVGIPVVRGLVTPSEAIAAFVEGAEKIENLSPEAKAEVDKVVAWLEALV